MSSTDAAPEVTARLPGIFTDLFPGAPRALVLRAATVAALVDELDRQFPGLGVMLRDERPAIREHINIFVEGERATLATLLQPGMEIFILTAISGG